MKTIEFPQIAINSHNILKIIVLKYSNCQTT